MKRDDIVKYFEMCDAEGVGMLQKGMTFRAPPNHGIILMSQRVDAHYEDALSDDGMLVYEGHDMPRQVGGPDPKTMDQPRWTSTGRLTENGKFADWIDRAREAGSPAAGFHVYEKLRDGVWCFRGPFLLRGYSYPAVSGRHVFKFLLEPVAIDSFDGSPADISSPDHSRQIPSWVKVEVYKRDRGVCVLCGASNPLHFDHELPYSRGGSSLTPDNVRLLCARCNLAKGARIE